MDPTDSPPSPSAWATIREALRGTPQDLTSAPLRRAVVLLAVPMVLEMSMESLFAVVDIFWVSRLGSDAVALVGITETMFALVYAIALGLASGATAIVARRIGEKNPDGAARAGFQAIAIAVILCAIVGAFGAAFAPQLLTLMGAHSALAAHGASFTAIMLGGNVTVVLLFVINAVFRGAGDAAVAMRSLWLANILNIILGPCFIFGFGPIPAMGVTGAAIATTLGRGIGVVYQLVRLTREDGRITVGRRHAHLDLAVLRPLSRISATAGLQVLIETGSWVGLVRILATFGDAALAGYTIAIRIIIFATLPSFGMANAAATLVGQNLGAGEPERAAQSVRHAAFYNVLFLGGIGAILVALPTPIVHLFSRDPEVVPFATDCLRILALGFLFYGFGMVAMQAFNGAGDTTTPTFINLVCFWLLKIPGAYLLANVFGMGTRGVFVAVTVAYTIQAFVAGALFRRGKWKTRKV